MAEASPALNEEIIFPSGPTLSGRAAQARLPVRTPVRGESRLSIARFQLDVFVPLLSLVWSSSSFPEMIRYACEDAASNASSCDPVRWRPDIAVMSRRSEEHTSELQSHSFISYAVFCL